MSITIAGIEYGESRYTCPECGMKLYINNRHNVFSRMYFTCLEGCKNEFAKDLDKHEAWYKKDCNAGLGIIWKRINRPRQVFIFR